jgi:hypothetical protein
VIRKTWVLAAAVVLLAAAAIGGVVATSGGGHATPAAQASAVNTATVDWGTLSDMVSQYGILTYRARSDGSPYAVINRAGGTYTKLPDAGDRVDCGAVLYRVNNLWGAKSRSAWKFDLFRSFRCFPEFRSRCWYRTRRRSADRLCNRRLYIRPDQILAPRPAKSASEIRPNRVLAPHTVEAFPRALVMRLPPPAPREHIHRARLDDLEPVSLPTRSAPRDARSATG